MGDGLLEFNKNFSRPAGFRMKFGGAVYWQYSKIRLVEHCIFTYNNYDPDAELWAKEVGINSPRILTDFAITALTDRDPIKGA